MKTIVTNMCMIYNEEKKEVLVLDKKKVEGWEGLTFPGGHVEKEESFIESCIREVKEETNLEVDNLEFKGFIQWIVKDENKRILGLLYKTTDYRGKLIKNNREGNLFWMDLEEFIEKEGKSQAMDDCLDIYLDKSLEVIRLYKDGEHVSTEYF